MSRIAGLDDQLRAWVAEEADRPARPIDKTLVHKRHEENVFVSRIAQLSEGEEAFYLIQLFLSADHAFFFEHPLDHYPGLMMVEAARQAATALTHLYYTVPLDAVYILQGLSVDFTAFAELGEPVFASTRISDKKIRDGQLTAMFCEGGFIQRGKPIGTMSGRWQIYDRRAAQRLRSLSRPPGP